LSTNVLLRLEAALVAVLALVSYGMWGLSWWLFALLVLAPDLSMLGYLKGPRIGAICYNAFHVYLVALAIGVFGWWYGSQPVLSIGIIWMFHIAMDRTLGFGLKCETSFQDTHLGRIGRRD
jgi:Domain of unknown function (DUF4260)